MVNPLYLIALALGTAFLLPLIEKMGKGVAKTLVFLSVTIFAAFPVSWLVSLMSGAAPLLVHTAGFSAPFSINLMVGTGEALFLMAMNTAAWLGCLYFILKKEPLWDGKAQVLFLTFLMGANGLVLTRDLFNIFVFMEISSLSMYALIAMIRTKQSYEAGFKYMIAGGIASALFLIGVMFVYRQTGSLNIDSIMAAKESLNGVEGQIALFLVIAAILVELKPFPANGWGADAYEASEPGISAMASAVSATSLFFVLNKLIPLFSAPLMNLLVITGAMTFIFAQLAALKQSKVRRLLGYSSIGQVGLLILIAGLFPGKAGFSLILLLAVNHLFSKAGLFWIAGLLNNHERGDAILIKKKGCLVAVFAILIAALAGLPPFPAFWAKWNLVTVLGQSDSYALLAIILAGSLLEAFYLFRWFLGELRNPEDSGDVHSEVIPEDSFDGEKAAVKDMFSPLASVNAFLELGHKGIPALLSAVILTVIGIFVSRDYLVTAGSNPLGQYMMFLPLAGIILFGLFDLIRLPVKIQILAAIAILGAYGYMIYPSLDGLRLIFGVIFIAGSLIQLFAFMMRKNHHPGLVALLMGMILSLGNLLVFTNTVSFFFTWEMMTLTSFFLIARGNKSSGAALRYMVFSLGGAFLILAGLVLSGAAASNSFADLMSGAPLAAVLLTALGFLIKLGALGLHIWLPGAYAEADDDVSSLLSSVLSKAALFMLFITAGLYTTDLVPQLSGLDTAVLLGWIGAFGALAGAFMALFQEDIKYTLAYSSMGQIGYMLLSFALMTQLGWMNSLYLAVTHLLFKGMLFLAVAGVIHRTKTRMMYQMGGLIQKMPISFFTVLMAIIALSGVPPLTGFGAKWMLYTALIEKGWYLQAGVAMFASGVAFLYLFRLIHVIFLGQLKDEHREVKEAPFWVLIPQIVFIIAVLLFSMFPHLILKPIQDAVSVYFPTGVSWDGYTVLSSLGYWNGNAVMYVTMGVFMVPLIWLLIVQSNPQKVKQFNIVFASERPLKPETTHFGYNFFAHYHRAVGFMFKPFANSFWKGISSVIEVIASSIRRIYTGNGQTYAVQILLYLSILILLLRGGM
jgi:formate hydrogenlyase subunit 3/multisubunit Na+/H+ antiporter MnhD subunit